MSQGVSKLDEFFNEWETDVFETLFLIGTIGKYGGRGQLRPDHVPSFVAITYPDLDHDMVEAIRKRTNEHVSILTEQGLVSLEPELRSLLTPEDEKRVAEMVTRNGRMIHLVNSLVSYVFFNLLPNSSLGFPISMTNSDDALGRLIHSPNYGLKGLCLKVVIGPMVFTAVIQTKDDLQTELLKQSIIKRSLPLIKEKMIAIRTRNLPWGVVSLFPMISVLSHLENNVRKKATNAYIERVGSNRVGVLKSWFEDYFRARREIVSRVPDLDVLLGGMLLPTHAEVLYDPGRNLLSVKEFISTREQDSVDVREEHLESLELLSPTSASPQASLKTETRDWAKDGNFLSRWGHPYSKALDDLRVSVKDISRHAGYFGRDAALLSEESLKSWAEQEVNEIRYIAQKLNLEEELKPWLEPLHVYIAYSLNEYRPNMARDGVIVRRFYTSKSELFLAREVPSEGRESGWVRFEQAFPIIKETSEPFFEHNSSLIEYLGGVFGDSD